MEEDFRLMESIFILNPISRSFLSYSTYAPVTIPIPT